MHCIFLRFALNVTILSKNSNFFLSLLLLQFVNKSNMRNTIMKTSLYNVDPFKAHFYIVKLGLQGYTLFFLFLFKKIEAVLTSTHNLCFEQNYENDQNFLSENLHLLVVKFSVHLNRQVFAMQATDTGHCTTKIINQMQQRQNGKSLPHHREKCIIKRQHLGFMRFLIVSFP